MKLVRRALLALLVLLLALLVLPPLWFALFPVARTPLPPAERRVALPGGVAVNVLEAGRAGTSPPIVLVHGLPGSAYEWRSTLDALAARGRHALAYDRVGFGHSDPRPDDSPFTVEQNARELLAVLEALDLRGVIVVGWSYGGVTAMAAARQDPSRIAALVLVGSAGPGSETREPPLLVRMVMSPAGLLWLRAVPPVARGVRTAASQVAFSEQAQPDWWLPLLEANLGRTATGVAYVQEMRGMREQPLPDTGGLEVPVLVVHGDDDRLAPVAIGRELARRAPAGRLVEVPGGSHMLPITHAELLAREIDGCCTPVAAAGAGAR